MLSPGDILGPYEIERRIRSGGMATLYLARRKGAAGFARHLAVKVVNEELAGDDAFVKMFIDEAKLAARIQHPNVVHVEDFGESKGSYFIAMEYVHGCSLAQLVRMLAHQKRRLSPDLAVYIAMKVAEGLHAAHEATNEQNEPLNVVHRDVNPANILLAYKGHVKLIDFGIAKSTGRAYQTTGGSLKGKFRYMCPEQAMGKPIDRRADVYALGITLWEMLTARRLFTAETDIQILEVVRKPNVDPPSTHATVVGPFLDEVVMKALAPDREDRIRTAQELRQNLAQAAPAAAVLDASKLSGLLATVMQAQIQEKKLELPEGVAAAGAAGLPQPDEEVLKTMTVSETDISVVDGEAKKPVPPPAPLYTPTGDKSLAPIEAPSLPTKSRLPVLIGAGVGAAALVAIVVMVTSGPAMQDEGGAAGTATTAEPRQQPPEPLPTTGESEAETVDLGEEIAEPDAGPALAEASAPVEESAAPEVDPAPTEMRSRRRDRTASRMRSQRMTAPMMRRGAPVLVDDVF